MTAYRGFLEQMRMDAGTDGSITNSALQRPLGQWKDGRLRIVEVRLTMGKQPPDMLRAQKRATSPNRSVALDYGNSIVDAVLSVRRLTSFEVMPGALADNRMLPAALVDRMTTSARP